MSTTRRPGTTYEATEAQALPTADGHAEVSAHDFQESFGEELRATLDLETWRRELDLMRAYERIEAEVRAAVDRETELHRRVRTEIHPRLAWMTGAPRGAGVHVVPLEDIQEVHRGLLFNGGVEACDGTNQLHDTLPLTIYQIGIALVSYRGDLGTWCQRLFRRDLRRTHEDPFEETMAFLERRQRRGGLNQPGGANDPLNELAQRAIMSYAERAVLLHKATAVWRMGHGSPAPYELLTGGGSADLMIESIRLVRDMIERQPRFVFIASEPGDRAYLTIGNALRPLEYAIIGTLRERMEPFLEQLHIPAGTVAVDDTWDGAALAPAQWVQRFRDELAPRIVVGMYRATYMAPAHLFYAHEDHADVAARIALADSVLQEQRGFPLLIDLADRVCRSVYGSGGLREQAESAYAAAGVPFQYLSERDTRHS